MSQILIDLSLDPLTNNSESLAILIHKTSSSWAFLIYLINSPSKFQILIYLSVDPLIMYLESLEMHILFITSSWAL